MLHGANRGEAFALWPRLFTRYGEAWVNADPSRLQHTAYRTHFAFLKDIAVNDDITMTRNDGPTLPIA